MSKYDLVTMWKRFNFSLFLSWYLFLVHFSGVYEVTHHILDLGCVDFDIGRSTICLILLGPMRYRQNRQSRWSRWVEHPNQGQPNPGAWRDGPSCTQFIFANGFLYRDNIPFKPLETVEDTATFIASYLNKSNNCAWLMKHLIDDLDMKWEVSKKGKNLTIGKIFKKMMEPKVEEYFEWPSSLNEPRY